MAVNEKKTPLQLFLTLRDFAITWTKRKGNVKEMMEIFGVSELAVLNRYDKVSKRLRICDPQMVIKPTKKHDSWHDVPDFIGSDYIPLRLKNGYKKPKKQKEKKTSYAQLAREYEDMVKEIFG